MIKQLALAGVLTLALAGTAAAQSTAPAAAPAPTQHAMTPPRHDSKPGDKHDMKAEITLAQQTLTKAGLYKGKVNGEWNNDLTAAIKQYQTKNKLKVTGKLDDATLSKMKSETPAAPAPSGQ